jgi:hypothetical protein
VTAELRQLCSMGVYPTAELALIRKEYKVLELERSQGVDANVSGYKGSRGSRCSSRCSSINNRVTS